MTWSNGICATLLLGAATAIWAAPTAARAPGSTDAVIRQMEADSCPALLTLDMAVFERLFAADFVSVDPRGAMRNRSQVLAEIPHYQLSSCRISVSSVRSNQHVAVAIGTMTIKSAAFPSTFRYTDVFVRRQAAWVVLSSHQSLVADTAASAP